MFTNVFDVEMKRLFFDERLQRDYKEHIWTANFHRLMAYDSYHVAVRIPRYTIQYANVALYELRHDEKWDRFVKSDMLQKKAKSLLKVTPSVRDFHELRFRKGVIKYFD